MSRIPREIWVLVAAAFVIALGYGIVAPVLPQYARTFDVGVAAASMLISVFALFRLLAAPGAGVLIERFGERLVYIVGLLIVAISSLACALASDYVQLLVFRGLGGIGSTMFTVSAMGLIVRLAPRDLRGRTSALYGTAFLTGNIVGPILGSVVMQWGYRMPFYVYAVALFIAATVVAVFLSSARLRPAEGEGPLPVLTVREALGDSAYRAALVSSFANGWTNFGVRVALLPLFAAAVPAIGAPMAGVGLTVFAVGNAAMLQGSGRLVDRLGRRPVLIAGLLVCGVANAVFGWSAEIVAFLGLSALAGAGAALIGPAQQAAVADVVRHDRNGGKVLAAFMMASDLGAILGPVAAGFAADAVGFGWAFALTGLVLALAALPWWRARETLVRADPADRP